MKRKGGLYPLIAERDNLLLAFAKAQRGKQDKHEVLLFREHLHDELTRMRDELLDGTITVGDYHYFTVHDPKERLICAASFRERVLHHAVMNLCEPVFERYAIHYSYACRRGKGSHAAVRAAQQFSRRFAWCLKMDVAKYFDRVVHDLLLLYLGRLFKDQLLMGLFEKIVKSYIFPGRIDLGRRARRRFARKIGQYEGYFYDGFWSEATLARHAEALVGFTRLADARGFRRKVIAGLGRSPQGSNRVNRGGSWNNDDAGNFRAANRNNNDPANRNGNNGFRACLPPAQKFSGKEAADQEGVLSVGVARPTAKSATAARGW